MTDTFALVAGLIGLALAALGRLKPLRLRARLQGTLVFFGLAALAFWAVRLVRPNSSGEQFAAAATLLALGYLAVRLVSLAVFESLLARRMGIEMPRLARDVVTLIAYLLVTVVILRASLGLDIATLLVSSAVITVVIGLALQETLGGLLAGLALALEQRLEAGEWIELHGTVGRVEELGWRSLLLRTTLDERIVVPNSDVARTRLRLLGRGDRAVAVPIRLGVSYAVPPHEAKRVLERVGEETVGVGAGLRVQALVHEFAESAVVYEVRLWTREPWRVADLTDTFLTRAHAALAREGMEIPFPQRTLHRAPARLPAASAARCRAAMAACELFRGLPDSALAAAAQDSRWLAFAPGETVTRQGEESSALYVVASGAATVVHDEDVVGRVGPGDVFGEFAFLMEVPRVATVRAETALEVVEVDSNALRALLREHEDLLGELAERVAQRQRVLAERELMLAQQQAPKGFAGVVLAGLRRLMAG
jgi:small-conductance mechanosensitive channel/CRP-like cAMP-binding protein